MTLERDFDYSTCLAEVIVMAESSKNASDTHLIVSSLGHSGSAPPAVVQQKLVTARAGNDRSRSGNSGAAVFWLDIRRAASSSGEARICAALTLTTVDRLSTLRFALPAQQDVLISLLKYIAPTTIDSALAVSQDSIVTSLMVRIDALPTAQAKSSQPGQPMMLLRSALGGSTASTLGSNAAVDNANSSNAGQASKAESKRQQIASAFEQDGYPGPAPENPLISICLPVQNAEKSIARTLESIACQTFENFEVLVADDQSDDNTLEIVMYYASRDARIIPWINDECVGPAGNYNECLKRARGNFIKPLAQDAWLHPRCLEQMAAVMEREGDVALTISTAPDANLPLWCRPLKNQSQTVLRGVVQHGLDSLGGLVTCPSLVMFRAANIGKGYNTALSHLWSVDYVLRLLTRGELFVLQSNLVEASNIADNRRQWAGHYLDLAAEAIRIASSSDEVLKRAGLAREVFLDSTMLQLGTDFTARALQQGGIGLTAPAGAKMTNLNILPVAINLLQTLGRCQVKSSSAEAKADEIAMLEEKLRTLLTSQSWRMTKSLRDWNAALQINALRLTEAGPPTDWRENMSQQTYAELLRRLIREIKTSRSWRMTAPLRRLESKRYDRPDGLRKKANVRTV